jgi:hypothetical protein
MSSLECLDPGVDVKYSVQSSDTILFGRIIGNDSNSNAYTVQRYNVWTEPSPPPSFACLDLNELIITSFIEHISKTSVVDIIFVFSASEIQEQVISLSGISNVYFIRFVDTTSQSIPVTWTSFQRDSTSYPYIIFKGLSLIQVAIVRSINNNRLAQGNSAAIKISLLPICFRYLKDHLMDRQDVTIEETRGKRCVRVIKHDLTKVSLQKQVSITSITTSTPFGIEEFKCLFGRLIASGTRTKHPPLGGNRVIVQIGTVLNMLHTIKLLYVRELEELSITIKYNRIIS